MEAAAKQHIPLFRPPFGTIANPVRMMMLEHDRPGELLKEIRALNSDYVPPADGCLSYQTLYAALEALEKDLHQHIHMENNILFPTAIELFPTAIELPSVTLRSPTAKPSTTRCYRGTVSYQVLFPSVSKRSSST